MLIDCADKGIGAFCLLIFLRKFAGSELFAKSEKSSLVSHAREIRQYCIGTMHAKVMEEKPP